MLSGIVKKTTDSQSTVVQPVVAPRNAGTFSSATAAAQAVTRAAAKFRKKQCGRRGMPKVFLDLMYADYQRLNSCTKTANLWGVKRQSVFCLFKTHGLKLNPRNFKPFRIHDGVKYTQSKGGYWRDTRSGRGNQGGPTARWLHHEIWTAAHGPVPAGHQVSFKDADPSNCDLANLFCAPVAEVTLYHYKRLYPARANWTADDYRKLHNAAVQRAAKKRQAANHARGLTGRGSIPAARRSRGHEMLAPRKVWDFVYSAPQIVKEDRETKTVRRHVGRFTPKGAIGDLFNEIHAQIDATRPKDVYA